MPRETGGIFSESHRVFACPNYLFSYFLFFFQCSLNSAQDRICALESDVLRLEVLAQETDEQLCARQSQFGVLLANAEDAAATAELVASKEHERDTLLAKKRLYHLVTRTVWEKVKDDGSKVKGFVLNPAKHEVNTFTVDRKEMDDINSTNYLWDFIAAGVTKH